MTNQEILETAIQKAIDGEWVMHGFTDEGKMHFTNTGVVVDWLRGGRDAKSINDIIFNHDFAKALWGEESNTGYEQECETCLCDTIWYLPTWQYHLQQMVVADDPIEYLGENL